METSIVATIFQAVGMLLIAGLLWLLTPAIGRRFLAYWAAAWASLAAGLTALSLSFLLSGFSTLFHAVYCLAKYLFGFLLWAGCRHFARGQPLRRRDFWLLAAPAVAGIGLSLRFPSFNELFPFHAPLFAAFCVLAALATASCQPRNRQMAVGLRLLQGGLAFLAALFLHYGAVMGYILVYRPGYEPVYLNYLPIYDGLVEFLLAFSTVVLATESVRHDLEERNRQLAEASEQLTRSAHTDALTGLLNRRAFEDMLSSGALAPPAGAVAVVDLNNLKPINDRLGHAAGDAAIQAVARALVRHTRLADRVYRIGGDEFVVVLQGGSAADLTRRPAEVDRALGGTRLPNVEERVDLLVAWGVADFGLPAELPAAVASADRAMYACKQARKQEGR
jgi:diguanylate cyclase (GGDEF)-like protein